MKFDCTCPNSCPWSKCTRQPAHINILVSGFEFYWSDVADTNLGVFYQQFCCRQFSTSLCQLIQGIRQLPLLSSDRFLDLGQVFAQLGFFHCSSAQPLLQLFDLTSLMIHRSLLIAMFMGQTIRHQMNSPSLRVASPKCLARSPKFSRICTFGQWTFARTTVQTSAMTKAKPRQAAQSFGPASNHALLPSSVQKPAPMPNHF